MSSAAMLEYANAFNVWKPSDPRARQRNVAWCESFVCTGFEPNDRKGYSPKWVVKENAKRSDSVCPDCRSALFWGKARPTR